VNCETDFAARSEDFQTLVKDIAMHIAAVNPKYIRREDVPQEELQKEIEIYKEQARAEKKPEAVLEKIAQGKLSKYYQDFCLYDQLFVKDDKQTVEQVITSLVGKVGENIKVRRFVRYQCGEGLEKRSTDLKGEVESMLGGGQ
jgi:elongation factor Ts